jgi:hypothetical protein
MFVLFLVLFLCQKDDNLEQIKLRSTDVDRTIKSAYHFIGGLFPSCEGVVDLEVQSKRKLVCFCLLNRVFKGRGATKR